MTDLKDELHRKLQAARAGMLSKLEGLSEYDRRRPMTASGTNLLGLVKHLAGVEYAYLGESFGRPAPETMSWVEDGSVWDGADMWATAEESSAYLIGLYERACRHSDQTLAELELDAPARCRTGRRSAGPRPWGCCSSGWSPRRPSTPATPTSCAN